MDPDGALPRPIQPANDESMARILRSVMSEFRACGPGFATNDPEVNHMSRAYGGPGVAYVVLEIAGRVVGGGGIAPLAGGEAGVCELRKMYFLPEARGHENGRQMLERCLAAALALGVTGHSGCGRWFARDL